MHPLSASALMGALWGPWHLPLWFTPLWQGREPAWLLMLPGAMLIRGAMLRKASL